MSGTGNFAEMPMCVEENDDICIQAKLQSQFPLFIHSHCILICFSDLGFLNWVGGGAGVHMILLLLALVKFTLLHFTRPMWPVAPRGPPPLCSERTQSKIRKGWASLGPGLTDVSKGGIGHQQAQQRGEVASGCMKGKRWKHTLGGIVLLGGREGSCESRTTGRTPARLPDHAMVFRTA